MQAELAEMNAEDFTCGGAEKFLSFLTTELRDFIGSKYNISDDSTYIGDSMYGLFGIYTLFNKPDAFNRYVLEAHGCVGIILFVFSMRRSTRKIIMI